MKKLYIIKEFCLIGDNYKCTDNLQYEEIDFIKISREDNKIRFIELNTGNVEVVLVNGFSRSFSEKCLTVKLPESVYMNEDYSGSEDVLKDLYFTDMKVYKYICEHATNIRDNAYDLLSEEQTEYYSGGKYQGR